MKALRILAMMAGITLLLATESESGMSNIIGLVIVAYEAYKLGILYK